MGMAGGSSPLAATSAPSPTFAPSAPPFLPVHPSDPTSVDDDGFTLMEVMVVLVIISLVTVLSVVGLRSFAKTDLRSTASRMAGAVRFLFDRASTTGKVHRLVLDFDDGKYWAEVTDDPFIFAGGGKETEESRRKEAELHRQRGRAQAPSRREGSLLRQLGDSVQVHAQALHSPARQVRQLPGDGREGGDPEVGRPAGRHLYAAACPSPRARAAATSTSSRSA